MTGTSRLRSVLLAGHPDRLPVTLAADIRATEGLTVAAVDSDGPGALRSALALAPDVLALAVDLPGRSWVEVGVQTQARHARSKLILFGAPEAVDPDSALRVGLSGLVVPDEPRERMVAAIRTVAFGGSSFSPAAQSRLAGRRQARPGSASTPLSELSPRELEVLRLVVRGRSNKEIAAELKLAVKTVERHLSRLMDRVGLRDRVSLGEYAVREGIER